MKKLKKLWYSVISIILVLVMMGTMLPLSVMAKGAQSLTAEAYQMKAVNGTTSFEKVTNAVWNSPSNSGVFFYYTLNDGEGSEYSNNMFAGGASLPATLGKIYYAFIYYDKAPATDGKELTNVVPVSGNLTQEDWLERLKNYEDDPANWANGSLDYTAFLTSNLTWVDASNTANTRLPLVTVKGGDGSITAEPHYYSVFMKWERNNGSMPAVYTDNGVVYVHDASSGSSGFAAPATAVSASPYRSAAGSDPTIVSSVETKNYADPGVYFHYTVRDSANAMFSSHPSGTALGAEDGVVEYVYVYSDTEPQNNRTLASLAPVGRTQAAWQNTVQNYEITYTSMHPGEEVNYNELLGSLSWTSSTNNHLQVYSDEEAYGTPSGDGSLHYRNRYYSVLARWRKGGATVYSLTNALVYLHEKEPDVITSPISEGYALAYLTASDTVAPSTSAVIVSPGSTDSGVDFRYSLTDGNSIVWTNIPGSGYQPADSNKVKIEYLWTYTDNSSMTQTPAGRIPFGMSSLEWNNLKNDYISSHADPRTGAVDYSDLICGLDGWTEDSTLPILDDEAVCGVGNGEKGVYTSRYYSCMVRVSFLDGSGYQRGFINTGVTNSYVQIKYGTVGVLNAPITVNSLTPRYYNNASGIWSTIHTDAVTTTEEYTPIRFGYRITDNIGQCYSSCGLGYDEVPLTSTVSYLWTWVAGTDYTSTPGIHQIPIGMTAAAWEELLDGKTAADYPGLLESLDGWTTDSRLPAFDDRERDGVSSPLHSAACYGCFIRIFVPGAGYQYYWNSGLVCISFSLQSGPNDLHDGIYNIGLSHPDQLILSAPVTCGSSQVTYRWYRCLDENGTGASLISSQSTYTLSFPGKLKPGESFEQYIYMTYSYEYTSGSSKRTIQGRTNIAHYLLTDAPITGANVRAGKSYYGGEGNEDIVRMHASTLYDGFSRPDAYQFDKNAYQIQGANNTLSASWHSRGACDHMTWQWLAGDTEDEINTPIGTEHTVNDPCRYHEADEYGGYNNTLESDRFLDIHLDVPSDEVGTKYYRLKCVGYSASGSSYTSYSDPITVVTWPKSRRDDLYTITEDGTVTRYLGFDTELVIPEKINGIDVKKISFNYSISGVTVGPQRIVIPEGVTELCDYAFSGLCSLSEIVLPSTLKSIGVKAFYRCGLEDTTIPNGVEIIHKNAFEDAFTASAEVIVKADGVTVNSCAFNASRMQKVVLDVDVAPTLGAEVDEVDYADRGRTFMNCPNLYYFEFPEDVEVVTDAVNWAEEQTIYRCPKLTWVENYQSIAGNDKTNGICDSIAKCLINEEAVRIGDWIVVPDYNMAEKGHALASSSCGWSAVKKLYCTDTVITIPSELGGKTVTGWGCGMHYSFCSRITINAQYNLNENWHVSLTDNPEELTEVVLPTTMRNISEYAAAGYASLTMVNFGDCPHLSKIGMSAFRDVPLTCPLTLPGEDHTCYIGAYAFENTKIPSANLAGAVIFPYAFEFCYDLESVEGNWKTETFTHAPTLYNLYQGSTPFIFRYFYLVPAFSGAYNWYSYYGTAITDENAAYIARITGMEVYRMYKTEKYWYSGTKDNATIRNYIGYDDDHIVMPSMIYNIALKTAFHIKTVKVYDERMNVDYSMELQEGIETLGGEYRRLASVTLPEGLVDFGQSFMKSELLTELTIPSTVREIAVEAFSRMGATNYNTIRHITFASGSQCKRIGSGAFYYCKSLEDINLPTSLESIGTNAFLHCEDLTSVILPDSLVTIENGAFAYSGLTALDLPESLAEIGEAAFRECDGLSTVTIPASVRTFGRSIFDNCTNLTQAHLSDSMTAIPAAMFSSCENLTEVNIPASCKEIGMSAFRYCTSLSNIDLPYGVNRIDEYAFADTAIESLTVPVSVDFIGSRFVTTYNGEKPTVTFYSHSAQLPYFEAGHLSDYIADQGLKKVYCYYQSGAYYFVNNQYCAYDEGEYKAVQLTEMGHDQSISYSTMLADTNYRLLEIFDCHGEQLSSADVEEIRWYDEDTNALIHKGREIEIPDSMASIGHTVRCEVTFTDEFTLENLVDQKTTYYFGQNEMRKTVALTSRPVIQIRFIPPQYFGTQFILSIKRPDGNKYYSDTNTVIDGKPAFNITTEWFPTKLTLTAENFDTKEITNVQGEPIHANTVDLGEITMTPNGPLLHYNLTYRYPGESEPVEMWENIPGEYTLYNHTQEKDVTGTFDLDCGTMLTLSNLSANAGDVVTLHLTPQSDFQNHSMSDITFTVPWADGSGELDATYYDPGTLELTRNGAQIVVFNERGENIFGDSIINIGVKRSYSLVPGTYRISAFRVNSTNMKITSTSDLDMLNLSAESLYSETVTVAHGEKTSFTAPLLAEAEIADMNIGATVDRKGLSGEYFPVTVEYSFDDDMTDMEKKIVITCTRSENRTKASFLQNDGAYLWPTNGTKITSVAFEKPNEENYKDSNLTVTADSVTGSFVIYALYGSRFSFKMKAGGFSAYFRGVTTPGIDGELSAWTLSTLPAVKGDSNAPLKLEVTHPKTVNNHYFRVYRNHELIEEEPGCGYTKAIIGSAGSFTIQLPSENLDNEMNMVKYDFSVSTIEEDPALFTYGAMLLDGEATEKNTRIFDTQSIIFLPVSVAVPTASRLDIRCTNYNATKNRKYTEGSISLDGSEPDHVLTYYFVLQCYYNHYGNGEGYVESKTNIMTREMVYDYSLTVAHPELVLDDKVTLTVYCGETSADPTFDVTLHRNSVTGTYDGQLVMEGGQYTPDQLPAYFDVDFHYDNTQSHDKYVYTDEAVAQAISEAEESFTAVQEQLAFDKDELSPTDSAYLLNILEDELPEDETKAGILEAAQVYCDFQNAMADNYAATMEQLGQQIMDDPLVQTILNNGFIDPADFGDDTSETKVYDDLDLEPDELISQGFKAYPGEDNIYYVLSDSRGAAFYDPTARRMQVASYDKNNPLPVTVTGDGPLLSAKKIELASTGAGVFYEFDEATIGHDYAYAYLKGMLEEEKAKYDSSFGDHSAKLADYVNKVYSKIGTLKMFFDLAKESVNDYAARMNPEQIKAFKEALEILPNKYKESAEFGMKVKAALLGVDPKKYGALVEIAARLLGTAYSRLKTFYSEVKVLLTESISKKKVLADISEMAHEFNNSELKKKGAEFLKSPGFAGLMIFIDVVSGLYTIVNAYSTYLGLVQGNINNQFGWMVNRLGVTPKGEKPGEISDQYKQCVRYCFEYADVLDTIRNYYEAAFIKEVVSFVATIAADIVGLVNPVYGLAVGVCNWSLGNVSEIFTKCIAGHYEVDADKLESMVDDNCIGPKNEPEESNSGNSGGNSSSGSNSKNKKPVNHNPHKSQKSFDPAGYVYEAVASNRVEGAVATCYYQDDDGNAVVWDASESDQINPQITNADGEFQWFVPIGKWKVIAQKEGYLIANSENDPAADEDGWLPVPPPQMEVYIPMTSTTSPTVEDVSACPDYIRIEFSQYMDIDELTFYKNKIVSVTDNGEPVALDYIFIDREVSPTDSTKYYGRILTVSRKDGEDFNGDKLKVLVDKDFYNYAGNGLAADYESDYLSVGQIAGSLSHSYPNRFAGSIGEEADIVLYLRDTAELPMVNTRVFVESSGGGTLQMPSSVLTDENGRAVFHVTAASSGYDTLTFSCGDVTKTLETYVNPIGTVKPEKPTANLSDYQVVTSGTQLTISCATEGAVIRYTVNNTCPCDESALVYDGPITITGDVFVRIAAWTETGGYSERLNLHILCGTPVEGHSISLNGDIGINYYLDLDKTEEEAKDIPVTFTWTVEGKEKTAIGSLKKDTDTGLFKTSCPIAVAEMTYGVTLTFIVDGVTYSDTYSAVSYANRILTDDYRKEYRKSHSEDEYNKLAELVKSMLYYGAKAQAKFGRDVENPADAGIDYTPTEVTAETIGVTGASNMYAGLDQYGLEYAGSTVVYLSKTSMRHYYRITDDDDFEKIADSVTFNGAKVNYTDKDDQIYFELKNIAAPNLDELYVIKIGSAEYQYSVLDYVKACLNSGSIGTEMKELAAATYLYNRAANNYFET